MPLSFQRVKSTIFLPIGGKPSFYSSHVEPAIGFCVCNNSLCHNLFSPIQSLQSLLTATFQHTMKPKITSPVTSPLVLISVAAYFGGHFLHMQQKLQEKFSNAKWACWISVSAFYCALLHNWLKNKVSSCFIGAFMKSGTAVCFHCAFTFCRVLLRIF